MLLVKTKLGSSKIQGIGLFADQFIKKGTITWRFEPPFDLYFEPDKISKMPKIKRDFFYHFSYLSKKSGRYIFCIDNTRFINHSSNPNIDSTHVLPGNLEVCDIAKRDIKKGEEITVDYKEIDALDAKSFEKYLHE